jgi:hypothetical protein
MLKFRVSRATNSPAIGAATNIRMRMIQGIMTFSPSTPSRSGGGLSVILLLQNHPDDEDQSGDDANLRPQVSGPFPALHFPFTFSPISTSRRMAFDRVTSRATALRARGNYIEQRLNVSSIPAMAGSVKMRNTLLASRIFRRRLVLVAMISEAHTA